MDQFLLNYYQGSLETPEGFKGFPPNASGPELAYICSNIQHPEQYIECTTLTDESKPQIAQTVTQQQPKELPATGSHGTIVYALLFVALFVGWSIFYRVMDKRHG